MPLFRKNHSSFTFLRTNFPNGKSDLRLENMYFNFPCVTLVYSFTNSCHGQVYLQAFGGWYEARLLHGLKVALNTLALKWELHIIYWIHKQVGRISQGRTMPNVFLLLYWISTFTSSRTLHNSVLCFFSLMLLENLFFLFFSCVG